MRYLLLSVLVVCVIGIMIPSAFAQNQIPIEIISKTNYTFDQVISLTIEVDRYLPNTPFEVYLCKVGYADAGCKGLPTRSFIGGDVFGGKIAKWEYILRTDIDSALKKTGTLHFRLPMSNCSLDPNDPASGMGATVSGKEGDRGKQLFSCNPSGKYRIVAIYGPLDDPVGKGSTQFSYSNNLSDEGKKLAEFLVLSKWDIGTNFDFDNPIKSSTPEDLGFETHLHDSIKPPRVLLKSEQPEISLSKNYGSLDVFIMQFENEIKAKRYQQEISNFAPARAGFYYDTGESEFNLYGFNCIRNDRINSEANIQSGGARFDVQSYSCVRDNLVVYVEGSSSVATVAYEPILKKSSESDYFQQLEVPAAERVASTQLLQNTYTDPENRFSIEYPSDWFHTTGDTFDVGFADAELDATIFSIIMHFPNDGSSRDIGYFNYVKLFGKISCEHATYEENGYICSNYDVKETKTLDIDKNRKAFLVKAYSQRTYEDLPYLNHPHTIQHVLIPAEDYDWIIYSQSDDVAFANHSDRLLQMIKSFSLTPAVTASEQAQQAQQTQQTQQTEQQSKGGGCLIATAAFGSEMSPQVQFLREIRDNTVLQTESGSSFMAGFNQFYYSFSPAVADYERENPAFKEAVKITLTPLLTSLTLLQYADIDSESEMLGYGIGVILLNIGMYFVAPAVLLSVCIRKISKN